MLAAVTMAAFVLGKSVSFMHNTSRPIHCSVPCSLPGSPMTIKQIKMYTRLTPKETSQGNYDHVLSTSFGIMPH